MDNIVYEKLNKIKDKKTKCLVVGDLMMDKYVFGKLRNILSEANVPILNSNGQENMLGGAANVASNIKRFNVETYVCGIIGNDKSGRNLLKQFKQENIKFIGLTINKYKTTTKIRFCSDNTQLIRVDVEEIRALKREEELKLLYNIEGILNEVDIIILSDYCKGVLTENISNQLIQKAKKINKKIIVNTKERKIKKYNSADIISLNYEEFCKILNQKVNNNEEELTAYGKSMIKDNKLNGLLITRAEKGVMYIDKDGSILKYNSIAKNVCDVSGAGDTLIASFSGLYSKGLDMKNSVRLSNITAGIAVQKYGTCKVTIEELSKYIESKNI